MLISSILSPLPSSKTNPSPQEPQGSESQAKEAETSTQTDPQPQSTEPAQTDTPASLKSSEKPSEVTSQSIVEANSDKNLAFQSQIKSQAVNGEAVANSEAAARAAAEAYRAEVKNTAILERNASAAKPAQDDLRMSETKPAANLMSTETGVERAPLNKTV